MTDTTPENNQQLPLESNGDWHVLPPPKIRHRALTGVSTWAHAYAGFSLEFALEAARILKTRDNDILLDPFVGSGTTATAAISMNLPFIGVDLDPFSALLTRAKVANKANERQVQFYLEAHPRKLTSEFKLASRDLFDLADAGYAAGVYHRILADHPLDAKALWVALLDDPEGRHDSIAVALAAVVVMARSVARVQRGSNPVWLKKSVSSDLSGQTTLKESAQSFAHTMLADLSRLAHKQYTRSARVLNCDFRGAVIPTSSVDCVVTSPPYLNRLDYIVSHLPEITMLSGFISIDPGNLRSGMLGTTKMVFSGEPSEEWGDTCLQFLMRVKNHPSKASDSYYYRFYFQYFKNLFEIFEKLKQVCKEGASGLLVIQDSYYKELRIPISAIMRDFGQGNGFSVSEVRTEDVKGHMGTMSPRQRAHVQTKILKEQVLLLEF